MTPSLLPDTRSEKRVTYINNVQEIMHHALQLCTGRQGGRQAPPHGSIPSLKRPGGDGAAEASCGMTCGPHMPCPFVYVMQGLHAFSDCLLLHAGPCIGLLPLTPGASSSMADSLHADSASTGASSSSGGGGGGGVSSAGSYSSMYNPTSYGGGYAGSGIGSGLGSGGVPSGAVGSAAVGSAGAQTQMLFTRVRNVKGGRDGAGITGLCVLPCSKLLVLSCDDGTVKLCK